MGTFPGFYKLLLTLRHLTLYLLPLLQIRTRLRSISHVRRTKIYSQVAQRPHIRVVAVFSLHALPTCNGTLIQTTADYTEDRCTKVKVGSTEPLHSTKTECDA